MTTDPFNTADTYHDEMPHHLADHCEHAGVGKACRRCRRKFDAASQWTRDYLTQQEPTDAEVLVAMTAYEGHPDRVSAWRAALTAVRSIRRNEEKR